jgi:gamma-glutamylcyclotransferase (GGCT)/AIG2-like uncharacterized protein YtfP
MKVVRPHIDPQSPYNLFTYGTLMPEQNGKAFGLRNCPYPKVAVNGFELHNLGGFPGMIPSHKSSLVLGSIWRCPGHLFSIIDRYEMEGKLFFRKEFPGNHLIQPMDWNDETGSWESGILSGTSWVTSSGATASSLQYYEYGGDERNLIRSGDWLNQALGTP